MSITILSEDIINQIAAGEVIENPSAVIKELVENAIDAKATTISINIEQAGLKKIQVKDNGVGMDEQDLIKAPLRHATSKISSFEDLYSITSMGFRGEALASIFSIAKTTIQTKTNQNNAIKITSENIEKPIETGHSNGTTITVEDLFYNTPARKKYLKSESAELKATIEVVKRIALSHSNIAFELRHNDKQLFEKPQLNSIEKNIIYILGREYKNKLIEINSNQKGINITGFIANPTELSFSYKKNQYFFVNNRFVKSKLLTDALYEGFGSNLMVGKHPSFVLFIEIDPEIIDVNVHPTKIEIRFENEAEIFSSIKDTIKNTFETSSLFKEFERKEHNTQLVDEQISPQRKEEKNYFTKDFQQHFEIKDESITYPENKKENKTEDLDESFKFQKGPLFEELSEYRILGQLDKTYIIVETKNEMVLVDQHVAEEKYFYEKMIYDSTNNTTKTQTLLKPYIIQLDHTELFDYEENKNILTSIGFEHELFGNREIAIRSVPITIGHKINHPQRFKEILYSILADKSIKTVEKESHNKIASIACRSAVMSGDELTYPQMKTMVENLKYLKQPFQCPHGRPTFLKYDFKELQKKFKRIV